MRFISWLFDRTPRDDAPVPEIVIRVSVEETRTISQASIGESIVAEEPSDELFDPRTEGVEWKRFILEPMYLGISYIDASGVPTDRLIATRHIEDRGGLRYLGAYCHLRKAFRSFRLDRIVYVYDTDGEISETLEFFEEVLADEPEFEVVSPRTRSRSNTEPAAPKPSSASPYTLLRREIHPALTLLAGAARADNLLHPEEVDRIMHFTEKEALCLERDGILKSFPSPEAFEKLGRLIRRTRPTRSDVEEAIVAIGSWEADRLSRLVRGLQEVIVADGVIVASEEDFVRDILEIAQQS